MEICMEPPAPAAPAMRASFSRSRAAANSQCSMRLTAPMAATRMLALRRLQMGRSMAQPPPAEGPDLERFSKSPLTESFLTWKTSLPWAALAICHKSVSCSIQMVYSMARTPLEESRLLNLTKARAAIVRCPNQGTHAGQQDAATEAKIAVYLCIAVDLQFRRWYRCADSHVSARLRHHRTGKRGAAIPDGDMTGTAAAGNGRRSFATLIRILGNAGRDKESDQGKCRKSDLARNVHDLPPD